LARALHLTTPAAAPKIEELPERMQPANPGVKLDSFLHRLVRNSKFKEIAADDEQRV
jgi:hypothetical protein